MKHRLAPLFVPLILLGLLAGIVVPVTASGTTLGDRQAQAARLQHQIDANGDRISALGEQYNGALLDYDKATAAIVDGQRRYDAAQLQVDTKRKVIQNRAVHLYTNANSSSPLDAVDVKSVDEMARRAKYGSIAADVDGQAINRLKTAQEDLVRQRKQLEVDQAQARARKDAAANTKRQIEQANAEQQQLLGQAKGEIAQLMEQDRQRKEAAARASATSRSGRSPARGAVDPGSVGGNFGGVPAPSGRVAAVIAYARAQLGKPYVFATSGPGTFDCSGLTMMAWRQAGVSMAHFSGAQFNAFPHIPIGALQPGDLVFKGVGGRDHVALYIGGGMQIAATHTGDYVRLQPLSSNLSGAVRPG